MPGRYALLTATLLAGGCGRLGFDDVTGGGGDGGGNGDGGIPISLELPAGGDLDSIAIAPDGTWYGTYVESGIWRSDDQHTWTRCGAGNATQVAVGSDGLIYGAGETQGVLVSTDRCATWTTKPIDRPVLGVGTSAAIPYALVDNGLRSPGAGGGWMTVATPADGNVFISFANRGTRTVIGTQGAQVVVDSGTGYTHVTTGFATTIVSDVTVGTATAYAITQANSMSNGAISCADAALTTWAQCFNGGGNTLAVDPNDDQHLVFAPYDNLGQTTNAFGSFTLDLQQFEMDGANVNDLVFTPTSGIVAATWSGVYFAADSGLRWEARIGGLSAWDVQGITVHGDDLFLNTQAGVMRSVGRAPFTLSTKGMFYSTRGETMAFAPDGTLLTPGREIWASTDLGATWTAVYALDGTDGYYGPSITMSGSRAFVGTYGHVRVSDPPYTTWTPHQVAGAARDVFSLLAVGGRLWTGTKDGLFVSIDDASTFTAIPSITSAVEFLIALPDGGIAAATDEGVWVSDPSISTWALHGPGETAYKLGLLPGTGLIAATDHGGYVSRDRGVTWTQLAGSQNLKAKAAIYDAATDTVVLGTLGQGLVRFPLPP